MVFSEIRDISRQFDNKFVLYFVLNILAKRKMSYKSIKIAGHFGVGKTHMFHRFNTGKWPDRSFYFGNDQVFVKDYLINGEIVRGYVNDCEESHEEWEPLRFLAYRYADCVILCFGIDRPFFISDMLIRIEEYWYPFFQKYCPKAKLILVGTKKDLRTDQDVIARLAMCGEKPVTYKEGQELSKKIKAECYLECSALTGEGIQDVFHKAIELASQTNINHDRRRECYII